MTNPVYMEKVNRWFGDNHVLRDTAFTVEAGTITGLLGVNGAGKTTMMRCFLGLIRQDSGRCEIYGEDSWTASPTARSKIGFVPQLFDGFKWMTVDQSVGYTGAFYDNWNTDFVDHLITKFELDRNQRIADMSVGMQQRVSIILAWGHQPDLLVLDEPVASLDPVGRRTFIELLLDVHMNEGNTIIFSTHITSDVERVAARVALMQSGQVAIHTDLEDLKESFCRVHLHSISPIADLLRSVPGCLKKEEQTHSARLVMNDLDEAWLKQMRQREGLQVEVERLNLDEIFLALNS